MNEKELERWQNVYGGLKQTIHHLTWLGEFWGQNGAIALHNILIHYQRSSERTEKEEAAILSALSSTYYAAAGNARARAGTLVSPFAYIRWMIRALLYLKKAGRLSNKMFELVGINNLTPAQLDIRSAIKRKLRQHHEALRCVQEALSRPDVTIESRVLLLIGRAESEDAQKMPDRAQETYQDALALRTQVPATTSVRLLRSLSKHYEKLGSFAYARSYQADANALARREGLQDQVLKIGK